MLRGWILSRRRRCLSGFGGSSKVPWVRIEAVSSVERLAAWKASQQNRSMLCGGGGVRSSLPDGFGPLGWAHAHERSTTLGLAQTKPSSRNEELPPTTLHSAKTQVGQRVGRLRVVVCEMRNLSVPVVCPESVLLRPFVPLLRLVFGSMCMLCAICCDPHGPDFAHVIQAARSSSETCHTFKHWSIRHLQSAIGTRATFADDALDCRLFRGSGHPLQEKLVEAGVENEILCRGSGCAEGRGMRVSMCLLEPPPAAERTPEERRRGADVLWGNVLGDVAGHAVEAATVDTPQPPVEALRPAISQPGLYASTGFVVHGRRQASREGRGRPHTLKWFAATVLGMLGRLGKQLDNQTGR